MPIDETPLFEEFVRARQEAVELTDRYRDTPADAPNHDQLWERVVRQTEEARVLLEAWLERLPYPTDVSHVEDMPEREPLTARP